MLTVQGMDYYYTLQGWLKGVNMPSEGDPGEDGMDGFRTGTDAFAFALGYYEGDFKPINPNAALSDNRGKLWDRYRDIRDTVSAAGLNPNLQFQMLLRTLTAYTTASNNKPISLENHKNHPQPPYTFCIMRFVSLQL